MTFWKDNGPGMRSWRMNECFQQPDYMSSKLLNTQERFEHFSDSGNDTTGGQGICSL